MKPRLLAVTGGVACGKSSLAKFLAEMGCAILDTDDVSHGLQGVGGAAVGPIAERFGRGVVAPDGSIDRRKLGGIVFGDAQARAALEAIMHPLVEETVRKWIGSRRQDGGVCAVLVPLLYEAGLDRRFPWDAIAAVVASRETQLSRLAGRGFGLAEAESRIDSQMPCVEKARKADFAINNDGSLEELKSEARRLLDAVKRLPSGEKNERNS